MTKRIVDKDHLQYVSTLSCMICGARKQIQVHHLLKPYDGMRGLSMRAGDNNVVPLCFQHHTELHTKFGNEEKFFIHHGYFAGTGRQVAKSLWESRTMHDNEVDDGLPF